MFQLSRQPCFAIRTSQFAIRIKRLFRESSSEFQRGCNWEEKRHIQQNLMLEQLHSSVLKGDAFHMNSTLLRRFFTRIILLRYRDLNQLQILTRLEGKILSCKSEITRVEMKPIKRLRNSPSAASATFL